MTHKKPLFDHLNGFFDHIYIITLKRSKDRHVLFQNNLEGLNYEIFWGTDGNTIDLDQLITGGQYDPHLTLKKIPIGKDLKRGEIGCAMSHLSVYKDIIDKGYKNALILEDDITIDTSFTNEFSQSLSELPENWEILYLGYLYNNNKMTLPIYLRLYFAYPLLNLMGFKNYNKGNLRRKFPRQFSENLQYAGFHYGTHAYAVSANGAKKIIRYQTPISMAIDNAVSTMCMEGLLKAFRLKKRLFHQNRTLPSTISRR